MDLTYILCFTDLSFLTNQCDESQTLMLKFCKCFFVPLFDLIISGQYNRGLFCSGGKPEVVLSCIKAVKYSKITATLMVVVRPNKKICVVQVTG